MDLVQAMGIVARAQQALVAAGYDIGTWGPCQDGIDGRWGPDTREGWGKALADAGLAAKDGTQLLRALGITEYDGMTLQTAITTWNQWRGQQDIGSQAYEDAANAALAAATGITTQSCPEPSQSQGGTIYQPPSKGDELYYAPPPEQKKGWPWWLWLIIGLTVAGAAGGGLWYWNQYSKKKKRRRRKKSGTSGYGNAGSGTTITEEEMGGFSYTDNDDEGLPELDDDDEYS